jgi:hypothetical protein
MNREYFIRGQRKIVEEIDNVSAIKTNFTEQEKAGLRTRGLEVIASARVSQDGMPNETLAAFENANWLFLDSAEDAMRSLATSEFSANREDAGKLIKRPNGRFAIVTKRLNVQLDASLSIEEAEQVLTEKGLKIINVLRFAPNFYEVDTQVHSDSLEASVELDSDPKVILAEPTFIEYIEQRFVPTDPRFVDQWQWRNTGQNGGTPGADVSCEEAWDHTRGAGIRVAIIDNGFYPAHEDLQAGVVGVSGFFQNNTAQTFVQGTTGMPGSDHGTFCAGMVGARINNTFGGCGAAPESELMLLACLMDQVGTQTTLARAVSYAADPSLEVPGADPGTGADILVSSLGPNDADWDLTITLQLAIEFAALNGRNGRGLTIFWAASNGDVDVTLDEVVSHPDVMAVVRSTRMDLEDNAAHGATVDLIAPGVAVVSTNGDGTYGESTGTSFAAPCAAGCAALVLSVNPDLTRNELRAIMLETADKIGGVVYDADGHNDDYGFGRVNAFSAVRRAALRVDLETTALLFNNIPEDETTARAIVWQCFSVEPLTFQVVSGPTTITGPANSFQTILGTSVTIPPAGFTVGAKARLWLTYRGGAPDSTATGTIRVRCVETAEEWDVSISANAVERPKTAVMMVLDQSGSMEWDAGDGRTRVEVLREAALNFVDVLQSENGIGVVRFDHDAYLGMSVAEAGPEIFGPGRATALSQINSHTPNPEGATSIGDGIEMAASQLDTVTGYDHTAMIVLTDGQENTTKLIADVAGSVDDRTFAIGLGKPEDINPNALNDITNGTGGYVVMTGALSTDEYFILSKYYMQILAGVTNQEIVLDPQGYLQPGETQKVSFSLNEADSAADVIVLSPAPWALKMVLETPTGEILSPAALPMGIRFISTSGVAYFRFNLPVVTTGGRPAWAGKWVLHLECDKVSFRKYLSGLQNNPKLYEYTKGHGLRWSAIIEARSSLKFNASLHQKEILPGSSIHLAASLAEYGLPVENRAVVSAEMLTPDGALQTIELKETSPGHFASEVIAKEYGIYKFRMMAAGKTIRGNKFTREKTLTGSVYVLRPPVDPKPPVKDDDNCPKRIAVLLEIISKNPRLAAMLSSDLKKYKITLEQLFKCLRAALAQRGEESDTSSVQPSSNNDRDVAIAVALRAIADSIDKN